MDSSDTGSSEKGSSDPNATETSDASIEKAKAAESSAAGSSANFSGKSPSEALAEAVQHASHTRPGSSLILIPPVTRKAEGAHASPLPREDKMSSGPGLGSARTSRFAADFRDKVKGPRQAFKDKWQRYAVPAALGFCLFGVGLATGGQFFGTGNSSGAVKLAAADNEMRHVTKKLTDEIHALQARVASQSPAPDDIRSLKKSVDGLKVSLDSIKAETDAQIAELNAKIDHLQHEEVRTNATSTNHASAMANDTAIHTGVLQPASTVRPPAPGITGSIGHSGAAHNGDIQTALIGPPLPPKDEMQAPAPADAKKKQPETVLVDWVVRDVYRGVALIDGPDGTIEVSKGDMIPGAGTVESIEHRNGGWVLVTSRGIVASIREPSDRDQDQ
jgi:hypothetical protein